MFHCTSLLLQSAPVHATQARPTVVYKGKGNPYSITERRDPELIPVLGSKPAGDMSHKPGGRLPLLSATQLLSHHLYSGVYVN